MHIFLETCMVFAKIKIRAFYLFEVSCGSPFFEIRLKIFKNSKNTKTMRFL